MRLKFGGKRFGIRGQIVGGIVLLAVAATAAMGILSLKVIEQKVLYSKVREAAALAENFRLAGGAKAVKGFAQRSRRAGLLKDFEVVDKTGSLVKRSTQEPLTFCRWKPDT